MAKKPLFDLPITHRGYHNAANGIIENSASAFEAAIAKGYAIECDLQLTADAHAVVFHDYQRDRLTGHKGLVRNTTLNEMQSIPLTGSANKDCPQSLNALLEQVDKRTQLVIELKAQGTKDENRKLATATAKALEGYKGDTVIESFSPDLLSFTREAGYKGEIGCLVMNGFAHTDEDFKLSRFQVFALTHMIHWPKTRFTFISCLHTNLDLPMVRFWRALGMPVSAWTIRSQADADTALRHADQIVFEGYEAPIG